MKAIAVKAPGGYENMHLVERDDPGKPAAGEIRVAIKATSLNYHDMLLANGTRPTEDGRILMADGAGVVDAVGEGVMEFKPGDRVVSCFFPQWQDGAPWTSVGNFAGSPGDGINGFAVEYAVRLASAFTHAPKGWSFAEAATITTAGLTAWRALVEDGRLKTGDTVLTLGTGGVSLAALHICRMMDAALIITSSSDEKLERARALGADHGINYRSNPAWGKEVLKLTDGRGVDHVLETSGPGTMGQSLQAVRVGGHLSLIGVLTGLSGEIPTALLMGKQVRLQGLIVGSRRQQRDYVAALERSHLRPVIDRTYAMAELAEAFRFQQAGGHFGKICAAW